MPETTTQLDEVLAQVAAERGRQDAKWGQQDWHDPVYITILTEEVGEAAKDALDATFESEPDDRRAAEDRLEVELVQIAAVAVAHVQAIKRRRAGQKALWPTR